MILLVCQTIVGIHGIQSDLMVSIDVIFLIDVYLLYNFAIMLCYLQHQVPESIFQIYFGLYWISISLKWVNIMNNINWIKKLEFTLILSFKDIDICFNDTSGLNYMSYIFLNRRSMVSRLFSLGSVRCCGQQFWEAPDSLGRHFRRTQRRHHCNAMWFLLVWQHIFQSYWNIKR